MYEIGDKAQAYDGRIGVVVDTKILVGATKVPSSQHILVKFPDGSTMEGLSDNFKAVFDKPFAKVAQRY